MKNNSAFFRKVLRRLSNLIKQVYLPVFKPIAGINTSFRDC
jgi:hypothetical protein